MLVFENDYSEGAHDKVLKRLLETNMEQLPGYGTDPYCVPPVRKQISASGQPQAFRIFSAAETQ